MAARAKEKQGPRGREEGNGRPPRADVMPIPEAQLDTWSHQGAVTTASATYELIRRALTAPTSPIRGLDYEVFLQGSYKNSTNIRGDSDVDVVAQLNSTFESDKGLLTEFQRSLLDQTLTGATYLLPDFRRDVIKALRSYFGADAVTEGNKSLKLAAAPGRLAADVVVCLQYRRYLRFWSQQDHQFIEGIVFYTQMEGHRVINFSKPHYENGVTKNDAAHCNGWYKPAVRMFKNARTYLEDHGRIRAGLAPSYFLECLLYNVPIEHLGTSFRDSFCNVVNWLLAASTDTFVCQSEQFYLFGPTPEQWSKASTQGFVRALVDLWNQW